MKNYLTLFYIFPIWLFIELSVLVLIPTAYLIYPFIYPFRNTWLRHIFFIYFNDSEDGDFGDIRWQAIQKKPQSKWDWFKLSYRWNVRRNPVWNYTGVLWCTSNKEFNSPIIIKRTNENITARYSTAFHRGYYGYGLFLFKVGNLNRFVFSTLFEVGSYSIVIKAGFNEHRPMAKLAWVKTINMNKTF